MDELAWTPQSPLRHAAVAARPAGAAGAAGVRLRQIGDIDLVLVMARRGQWTAAAAAAAGHFGTEPPHRPAARFAGATTLVWAGPDQFFVVGPHAGRGDPLLPLRGVFGRAASLSDQSDGRSLIRVRGAHARDMLAKICSLDLDPAVFGVGAAAVTAIDHTSTVLWRGADEEGEAVYDLLVFSTFAESLWTLLAASAAEFGLDAG